MSLNNAPETWFSVGFPKFAAEINEALSNYMFEAGAQGVFENENSICGYFNVQDTSTLEETFKIYTHSLRELFPALVIPAMKIESVDQKDWANLHKPFFKPQKIAKNFYLMPPWERNFISSERLPLIIDPGQAFGTGLHPSTRLTLAQLERSLMMNVLPKPLNVLDVGTGTGILGIAAAKLGVQEVDCIDLDVFSVEAANDNAKLNNVEVNVSDTPLDNINKTYSLVLSNILLETHLELAEHYLKVLKPGGKIILSGLLQTQLKDIDKKFKSFGLVLEETVTLEDWASMRWYRRLD